MYNIFARLGWIVFMRRLFLTILFPDTCTCLSSGLCVTRQTWVGIRGELRECRIGVKLSLSSLYERRPSERQRNRTEDDFVDGVAEVVRRIADPTSRYTSNLKERVMTGFGTRAQNSEYVYCNVQGGRLIMCFKYDPY